MYLSKKCLLSELQQSEKSKNKFYFLFDLKCFHEEILTDLSM
jgi:hypothetical protein